jgi:hypothetical protein
MAKFSKEREAAIKQVRKNVSEERDAAIKQFMGEVSGQREALMKELQDQEGQMRAVLADLNKTLNTGNNLVSNAKETVASVKAYIEFLDERQARTGAQSLEKDFADVREIVKGTSVALQDARALIGSIEKLPSSPNWDRLVGEFQMRGLVDHIFWRASILVLLLLIGAVAAGIAYRYAATRLFSPGRKPEVS